MNTRLSPMLTRITAFLLFMNLCLAAGVQFPILKSIAWTGMIVSNSRTAPLKIALAKTFDGKHPCDLCRHISRMVKAEKTELKQSIPQRNHIELFCCFPQQNAFCPPHQWMKNPKTNASFSRKEEPFIPPPKSLLS